MQKCDFCIERWDVQKKPICIEACPMRALDAGPSKEIEGKYGDIQSAEGFVYSRKVKPSIIFRLKSNPQ
jgi:anaerobic dimethyl sulfoxide reductase subunit B (iron-sulfur subunit)